jgi:hypothetical protein
MFALSALHGVAERFQIRGEVNSVLQDILEDVEWTHCLNAQLEHTREVHELQHKLHTTSNELEERRVYDAHQREEFHSLGDNFVGELWALSFKITELERDNTDTKHTLEQFDSLKQQLARSEELVRTLQRTMSLNREVYNMEGGGSDSNSQGRQQQLAQSQFHLNEINENSLDERSLSDNMLTTAQGDAAVQLPTVEEKELSQAIISSLKEETGSLLLSLDESVLLNIFSFLDATDVVNAALVDIAFYSRVDALFGLGGTIVQSSDIDEEQKKESTYLGVAAQGSAVHSEINSGPVPTSNTDTAKGSTTLTPEVASNVEAGKRAAPAKKTVVQGSVVLQGSALPPGQSSANMTTAAAVSDTNFASTAPQQQQPRNALANMFSMLGQQNRLGGAGPGPKPRVAAGSGNAAASDDPTIHTAETTKTFATLANSMADKLSPAELNVIMKMTEDLRAKDRLIVKTKAEREDLAARLEGTEAVKEFLISKVRDTERSLKKCQEESVKVMQQTSSDQEVISFLDGRVKELEISLQRTASEWNAHKDEFKAFQAKAENRQTVLEDMLQFERQQLADSEREWKSTKKVLVKEVKHCRAQVLALQAERDSFRQKNMQLKQALLSINGGAGG